MLLVIEDDTQWIELIGDSPCITIATDAKAGLEILASQEIKRVLCDFHGIQKDGKTAHDIVQFCLQQNIPCELTTTDPTTELEFEQKYGIKSIGKMNMAKVAINYSC